MDAKVTPPNLKKMNSDSKLKNEHLDSHCECKQCNSSNKIKINYILFTGEFFMRLVSLPMPQMPQ